MPPISITLMDDCSMFIRDVLNKLKVALLRHISDPNTVIAVPGSVNLAGELSRLFDQVAQKSVLHFQKYAQYRMMHADALPIYAVATCVVFYIKDVQAIFPDLGLDTCFFETRLREKIGHAKFSFEDVKQAVKLVSDKELVSLLELSCFNDVITARRHREIMHCDGSHLPSGRGPNPGLPLPEFICNVKCRIERLQAVVPDTCDQIEPLMNILFYYWNIAPRTRRTVREMMKKYRDTASSPAYPLVMLACIGVASESGLHNCAVSGDYITSLTPLNLFLLTGGMYTLEEFVLMNKEIIALVGKRFTTEPYADDPLETPNNLICGLTEKLKTPETRGELRDAGQADADIFSLAHYHAWAKFNDDRVSSLCGGDS